MWQQLIHIIHVLAALALIGLVLVQQGKGAAMGAGFGSGSSGTVFGSAGAAPFLMKFTGFVAAVFFLTSLTLAHLASSQARAKTSVLPVVPAATVQKKNSLPTGGIIPGQQPIKEK